MPHLLDLQNKSYEWFLEKGLKDIFKDISPIEDASGNLSLSFEDFKLGEPSTTFVNVRNAIRHTPHRSVSRSVLSTTKQVKSRTRKYSWVTSH